MLLRRYGLGEAVSCERVAQGLLNRGYALTTTRGRYFLKHHLDPDRPALVRRHRATARLAALGLPVVPPLPDRGGATLAVTGGRCFAVHPWIDGGHRHGTELTRAESARLGELLGALHTALEGVMPAPSGPAAGARGRRRRGIPVPRGPVSPTSPPGLASANPADTYALIDELLARAGRRPHRDAFDALAEHRLTERRALLLAHAHRRPPPGAEPPAGWVHGDFHPLNVIYRGTEPAAVVDWDRLSVQPRAEETVRAAAIFFVRPGGTLALGRVRAYARGYRRARGAEPAELAAAVHRVWWERLNDFWMLRWRYELRDLRADHLFPAAAALAVWWTEHYEAVLDAFTV
ncbi:phosphotransferase [Streptomyces zingiberis]|uniref:Phosphotransferase n=1 Tax=Streptomyces zingiberis TaxID=2053010 RepID=A0ABX1BNJ2_9ACTN|nr:phosphotransferase [Streptomyces zingiberis]NJP99293.1 phosphotransferase [Streptomyces zingiberis]